MWKLGVSNLSETWRQQIYFKIRRGPTVLHHKSFNLPGTTTTARGYFHSGGSRSIINERLSPQKNATKSAPEAVHCIEIADRLFNDRSSQQSRFTSIRVGLMMSTPRNTYHNQSPPVLCLLMWRSQWQLKSPTSGRQYVTDWTPDSRSQFVPVSDFRRCTREAGGNTKLSAFTVCKTVDTRVSCNQENEHRPVGLPADVGDKRGRGNNTEPRGRAPVCDWFLSLLLFKLNPKQITRYQIHAESYASESFVSHQCAKP
ncbi:hypothetical protein J6590_083379 [Homalodisca vitripennis]|nr:hypothetical protein J6590_083379 [Homalodisca vitripennis]